MSKDAKRLTQICQRLCISDVVCIQRSALNTLSQYIKLNQITLDKQTTLIIKTILFNLIGLEQVSPFQANLNFEISKTPQIIEDALDLYQQILEIQEGRNTSLSSVLQTLKSCLGALISSNKPVPEEVLHWIVHAAYKELGLDGSKPFNFNSDLKVRFMSLLSPIIDLPDSKIASAIFGECFMYMYRCSFFTDSVKAHKFLLSILPFFCKKFAELEFIIQCREYTLLALSYSSSEYAWNIFYQCLLSICQLTKYDSAQFLNNREEFCVPKESLPSSLAFFALVDYAKKLLEYDKKPTISIKAVKLLIYYAIETSLILNYSSQYAKMSIYYPFIIKLLPHIPPDVNGECTNLIILWLGFLLWILSGQSINYLEPVFECVVKILEYLSKNSHLKTPENSKIFFFLYTSLVKLWDTETNTAAIPFIKDILLKLKTFGFYDESPDSGLSENSYTLLAMPSFQLSLHTLDSSSSTLNNLVLDSLAPSNNDPNEASCNSEESITYMPFVQQLHYVASTLNCLHKIVELPYFDFNPSPFIRDLICYQYGLALNVRPMTTKDKHECGFACSLLKNVILAIAQCHWDIYMLESLTYPLTRLILPNENLVPLLRPYDCAPIILGTFHVLSSHFGLAKFLVPRFCSLFSTMFSSEDFFPNNSFGLEYTDIRQTIALTNLGHLHMCRELSFSKIEPYLIYTKTKSNLLRLEQFRLFNDIAEISPYDVVNLLKEIQAGLKDSNPYIRGYALLCITRLCCQSYMNFDKVWSILSSQTYINTLLNTSCSKHFWKFLSTTLYYFGLLHFGPLISNERNKLAARLNELKPSTFKQSQPLTQAFNYANLVLQTLDGFSDNPALLLETIGNLNSLFVSIARVITILDLSTAFPCKVEQVKFLSSNQTITNNKQFSKLLSNIPLHWTHPLLPHKIADKIIANCSKESLIEYSDEISDGVAKMFSFELVTECGYFGRRKFQLEGQTITPPAYSLLIKCMKKSMQYTNDVSHQSAIGLAFSLAKNLQLKNLVKLYREIPDEYSSSFHASSNELLVILLNIDISYSLISDVLLLPNFWFSYFEKTLPNTQKRKYINERILWLLGLLNVTKDEQQLFANYNYESNYSGILVTHNNMPSTLIHIFISVAALCKFSDTDTNMIHAVFSFFHYRLMYYITASVSIDQTEGVFLDSFVTQRIIQITITLLGSLLKYVHVTPSSCHTSIAFECMDALEAELVNSNNNENLEIVNQLDQHLEELHSEMGDQEEAFESKIIGTPASERSVYFLIKYINSLCPVSLKYNQLQVAIMCSLNTPDTLSVAVIAFHDYLCDIQPFITWRSEPLLLESKNNLISSCQLNKQHWRTCLLSLPITVIFIILVSRGHFNLINELSDIVDHFSASIVPFDDEIKHTLPFLAQAILMIRMANNKMTFWKFESEMSREKFNFKLDQIWATLQQISEDFNHQFTNESSKNIVQLQNLQSLFWSKQLLGISINEIMIFPEAIYRPDDRKEDSNLNSMDCLSNLLVSLQIITREDTSTPKQITFSLNSYFENSIRNFCNENTLILGLAIQHVYKSSFQKATTCIDLDFPAYIMLKHIRIMLAEVVYYEELLDMIHKQRTITDDKILPYIKILILYLSIWKALRGLPLIPSSHLIDVAKRQLYFTYQVLQSNLYLNIQQNYEVPENYELNSDFALLIRLAGDIFYITFEICHKQSIQNSSLQNYILFYVYDIASNWSPVIIKSTEILFSSKYSSYSNTQSTCKTFESPRGSSNVKSCIVMHYRKIFFHVLKLLPSVCILLSPASKIYDLNLAIAKNIILEASDWVLMTFFLKQLIRLCLCLGFTKVSKASFENLFPEDPLVEFSTSFALRQNEEFVFNQHVKYLRMFLFDFILPVLTISEKHDQATSLCYWKKEYFGSVATTCIQCIDIFLHLAKNYKVEIPISTLIAKVPFDGLIYFVQTDTIDFSLLTTYCRVLIPTIRQPHPRFSSQIHTYFCVALLFLNKTQQCIIIQLILQMAGSSYQPPCDLMFCLSHFFLIDSRYVQHSFASTNFCMTWCPKYMSQALNHIQNILSQYFNGISSSSLSKVCIKQKYTYEDIYDWRDVKVYNNEAWYYVDAGIDVLSQINTPYLQPLIYRNLDSSDLSILMPMVANRHETLLLTLLLPFTHKLRAALYEITAQKRMFGLSNNNVETLKYVNSTYLHARKNKIQQLARFYSYSIFFDFNSEESFFYANKSLQMQISNHDVISNQAEDKIVAGKTLLKVFRKIRTLMQYLGRNCLEDLCESKEQFLNLERLLIHVYNN